MSYISAIRVGDEVRVWERVKGQRVIKTYPSPYYFYVEDPDGEYKSIHEKSLTRLDFDNGGEFYSVKRDYESSSIPLYESDIPPELKVLSQQYYNVPAPTLNITFLDIEVDYDETIGFSSVSNPYAPINSVAIYHQFTKEFIVLVVPPDDSWKDPSQFTNDNNEIARIEFCKNEEDLLLRLLAEIQDSDVICGWNSDFFDCPYITKRVELTLGKRYLKLLSFDKAELPKFRMVEKYGMEIPTVDFSGRISCDYMFLFQKYEAAERPSYKLEAISDEILPELPKLKYEGSLASLYRSDFQFFVRYNIRDTEILKGFEEKLGYVALANEMYHISTGLFKHVTGTLKLTELAIINYCHHELNGKVVPDTKEPDEDRSIQGAFVLEPKIGLHEWIGSLDINSLYPSSIRSINISPETLIGQFDTHGKATTEIKNQTPKELTLRLEDGSTITKAAYEWNDFLRSQKWAISGYGTVFNQEKKGIIPSILENWYATRKEYQLLKKKATEAGNKQEESYYDRLQYVYKIKLNSSYGALNNRFFKFYDLRMGESTTGTGRMILQHQCAKVNEIMTGEYDPIGEAIIYGDTDSSYFNTWASDKNTAIQIADRVAEKVNDSFNKFMITTFLCNPGFDDIIKAGREIVSDRGIFVQKKRYVLHIIDNEGKSVDKLKVMGLDTKRTTLPKEIAKKLDSFIERFLKGEEWDIIAREIVEFKESLEHSDDVLIIGLPKGVKKVEEYTQEYEIYGEGTRLPGHVAASIHYNLCLDEYNDKSSPVIMSGMKIKVYYLTQTYGKFKSIALPTDIETIPRWFYDNFTIDKQAQIKRLVDNPLENILIAIGKQVPTKQRLVIDSVFEF